VKTSAAERGRARTRKQYPIPEGQECQASGCSEPATCRHHKDGNPENTDPENIQYMCWPCHVALHVADGSWGRKGKSGILTALEVEEIRASNGNIKELAEELGIHISYAYYIRAGKRLVN
jgi:hypothetical protein